MKDGMKKGQKDHQEVVWVASSTRLSRRVLALLCVICLPLGPASPFLVEQKNRRKIKWLQNRCAGPECATRNHAYFILGVCYWTLVHGVRGEEDRLAAYASKWMVAVVSRACISSPTRAKWQPRKSSIRTEGKKKREREKR